MAVQGKRGPCSWSTPELFGGHASTSLIKSSYLSIALAAAGGVELAPTPRSGHWPRYANPVAMWNRIATFHTT
ncbi:hypothetical protein [Actinoplanes sp. NPDC026670]|uniref:hypothetical protein n=1 Tax=Actinoplanes sp. NPDC026670 TaxID=3154700 RepID=UPI0033FB336A